MDEQVQSANVAYDELYLLQKMIGPAGLKAEQVHYGYWPGREKQACKDFQDILVLKKVESPSVS